MLKTPDTIPRNNTKKEKISKEISLPIKVIENNKNNEANKTVKNTLNITEQP